MRVIFDFVKNTLRKIDGYWIEKAGHPVTVKGIFKRNNAVKKLYIEDRIFEPITPVLIYAFYDYPEQRHLTMFGIDSPDELAVQVNAEIICRKLGKLPEIGTLLNIEQSDWIVVNRCWIYNRFIGKYRIELLCQRYQESVTTAGKNGMHIQSSSKHTILDDEE